MTFKTAFMKAETEAILSRRAPLSFRVLRRQRKLARHVFGGARRQLADFRLRPMLPIAAALALGSALGSSFFTASENATRAANWIGAVLLVSQIFLLLALLFALKENRPRADSSGATPRSKAPLDASSPPRQFLSRRQRARVLAAFSRRRFWRVAALFVALTAITALNAAQRQLPPSRDVSALMRAVPLEMREAPHVTLTAAKSPRRRAATSSTSSFRCAAAPRFFRGRAADVSGLAWVTLPAPRREPK